MEDGREERGGEGKEGERKGGREGDCTSYI